jgi:hypothetical protein
VPLPDPPALGSEGEGSTQSGPPNRYGRAHPSGRSARRRTARTAGWVSTCLTGRQPQP